MVVQPPLPSKALTTIDPAYVPLPAKILVLLGPTAQLHSLVLESIFIRTRRGERLGVIVGDNHLDAYALARLARSAGFNPQTLLSRIQFSRPFTCHQLHHCILSLDVAPKHEWQALYVLGLLETFWDEDVRYADALRLLKESLARLKGIAASGLPILITLSATPRESVRQHFVDRVIDAADAYWKPAPAAPSQSVLCQLELAIP